MQKKTAFIVYEYDDPSEIDAEVVQGVGNIKAAKKESKSGFEGGGSAWSVCTRISYYLGTPGDATLVLDEVFEAK